MRANILLTTASETFSVDAEFRIGRPKMADLVPSCSWTLLALVRRNNFGHVVETVRCDDVAAFVASNPAWTFKNGRGRWHVVDRDHGTRRQWGEPITAARLDDRHERLAQQCGWTITADGTRFYNAEHDATAWADPRQTDAWINLCAEQRLYLAPGA